MNARYKAKIVEWAKTSPITKKLLRMIYENVFVGEPSIWISDWLKKKYPNQPGKLNVTFTWTYEGSMAENLESEVKNLLRQSDIYKVFDTVPENVWNILSKGDVFEWAFNNIVSAVTSGMRGESPVGKFAIFEVHEYVKRNEDEIQGMIKKKLEEAHPGIRCRILQVSPFHPFFDTRYSGHVKAGVWYEVFYDFAEEISSGEDPFRTRS